MLDERSGVKTLAMGVVLPQTVEREKKGCQKEKDHSAQLQNGGDRNSSCLTT